MIAERRWSMHIEGLVCKEQKVFHQQGHFLLTHSKKRQAKFQSLEPKLWHWKQIWEEEENDDIVAIQLWIAFNFA